MREAELNRRLADLERREVEGGVSPLEQELAHRLLEVERREREVERAEDALGAQRSRLEAVLQEYEARRDALATRGRELDSERERLRHDRAQLVAETIEVEQRERAVASAEAALVEPSAPSAPKDPTDKGGDWWAKQLNGSAASTPIRKAS